MDKEEILQKYADAKAKVVADTIVIDGKERTIYRDNAGRFASSPYPTNKEGASLGARKTSYFIPTRFPGEPEKDRRSRFVRV